MIIKHQDIPGLTEIKSKKIEEFTDWENRSVVIYQFFDSEDESFDTYASDVYVRNKINRVKELLPKLKNVNVVKIDISEYESMWEITEYHDILLENSCGIVQLPIPKKLQNLLDTAFNTTGEESIERFNYLLNGDDGDVDCMSNYNVGKFFTDPKKEINKLSPCTVGSVYDFLCAIASKRGCDISTYGRGKIAVVIGRSNIVGKPTAALLTALDYTVIHCHSKTDPEFIKRMCKEADLIVSAVGKANFITPDMVSKDKCQDIIDVGINRNADNKVCGDADPALYDEEAYPNLYITKVPGSIGFGTTVRFVKNIAYLITR